MIRSQIPCAAALCSLAVLVALFLQLPFIIFLGSLLSIRHIRYNAEAQPDNLTLSDYDVSFGNVHHLPPASRPHQKEHAHLHRRKTNENTYQASITKGWALRCLMDATIEEAPMMVQSSPKWKNFNTESEFIDPLMAPLEWGWDIKTLDLKDATKILSDYKVDKMLEFLHVSPELRFWTQQLVSHEREWHAEDGRTGPVCELICLHFIFLLGERIS